MGVTIIHLLCPTILLISVIYPLIRGWKRVNWLKSIALGWAFFVLGCMFREYLSPWLAETLIGGDAKEQVKCLNSYMIFGISLGWIFPLMFHGVGLYGHNKWQLRRIKSSSKTNSLNPYKTIDQNK